MFRLVSLLVVGCVLFAHATDPVVSTKLGKVLGFEYEWVARGGGKAEVFLGIPFAEPPVGDLRFEKPRPARTWSDVLNGTQFEKTCVPHVESAVIPTTSEDCLYLNVIRPSTVAPAGGYPVLVWVHGGGYEIGSASQFGYSGFAEIYTPDDVIVVTVQYRLGIFGFFSNGKEDMPGNLGLWDQTMAFQWINENIASFGGNPNQVTIWGLSAGGGSASELTLSPHSNKYIHGSIEMSGSSFAHWAIGSTVHTNSLKLAQVLECPLDERETKACMKNKTIQEIWDAVDIVGGSDYALNCVKWGPRVDNDFFPQHPNELVQTARRIPAVIGVAKREGAFFGILGALPSIHRLMVDIDDFATFDETALFNKIKSYISEFVFYQPTDDVVQRIVDFYTRNHANESVADGFYLDNYSEFTLYLNLKGLTSMIPPSSKTTNFFLSDMMFIMSSVRSLKKKQENGWPVYAYSFDHYNSAMWNASIFPPLTHSSPHVNEYPYMFHVWAIAEFDIDSDPNEVIVRDTLQQGIISFAKNGIPTQPHGDWTPVGEEHNYLEITTTPTVKPNFYQENYNFWQGMLDTGIDLVSVTPVERYEVY